MAIPNKGALSAPSRKLLAALGITLNGSDRAYFTNSEDSEIKVLFARARDIPNYVSSGLADVGITGKDIITEKESDCELILDLPFGGCTLVYAAPEQNGKKINRVATSFPNIARKYLISKGIDAELVILDGAVEASVNAGIADAVIDLTATGKTLRENGLIIKEEILETSAILIANKGLVVTKGFQVAELVSKIQNDWKFEVRKLEELSDTELKRFFFRGKERSPEIKQTVRQVFENVLKRKDEAVAEYQLRYDKVELKPSESEVSREEIMAAYAKVPQKLIDSLKLMKRNIEEFSKRELPQRWEMKVDGGSMGKEIRPLERVGVYAPGGTAAYPSSVLMGIVPAKVAGVGEVILCSPCNSLKECNPAILVAADIAGADRVFRLGGAQAIAAMGFGTYKVPRVNKIVGPGNAYVAAAKLEAQSYGIAIDSPAGPSEVMIIADETANPRFIAADLLAQAEHDANACPILVSTSEVIIKNTIEEIKKQAIMLPRKQIVKKAFENNGALLLARNIQQAIDFANKYAPEHLELVIERPFAWMKSVTTAGAIFIGNYSCEAAGDYGAGPNHILPTGGFARSYSGLSAKDFVREMNFLKLEQKGLENISDAIVAVAEAEGLEAHANSVRRRLEGEI
ncbi:MAG: histidinol dehydrogenase [Candidatus Micrarchaeota archaeon]